MGLFSCDALGLDQQDLSRFDPSPVYFACFTEIFTVNLTAIAVAVLTFASGLNDFPYQLQRLPHSASMEVELL